MARSPSTKMWIYTRILLSRRRRIHAARGDYVPHTNNGGFEIRVNRHESALMMKPKTRIRELARALVSMPVAFSGFPGEIRDIPRPMQPPTKNPFQYSLPSPTCLLGPGALDPIQ
ncbi:hypothetical protein CISG_06084 [Coccidioides immitis RMSCC 3703]|uniref:Uncharacterized protein n=2 Tax=Coccidioides immitis TaxID=5501 RepID=A0A0J8QYW1_COCIT|nr:hypothetical protein CIRG_02547 [Coccidioides immitis RMSCC 2394]KMU77240.1 hypothetical protein CISG_06084 [Coccidioides immitis RMSCC 3703]